MSHYLEHVGSEHVQVLRSTLATWAKEDQDVYLVSKVRGRKKLTILFDKLSKQINKELKEGHRVYTSQRLLSIFAGLCLATTTSFSSFSSNLHFAFDHDQVTNLINSSVPGPPCPPAPPPLSPPASTSWPPTRRPSTTRKWFSRTLILPSSRYHLSGIFIFPFQGVLDAAACLFTIYPDLNDRDEKIIHFIKIQSIHSKQIFLFLKSTIFIKNRISQGY